MNALNHPAARQHSFAGAWQRPAKGFVSMATLSPPQEGFGAEHGRAADGLPLGWQRTHQTMASIRSEYMPNLRRLQTAAHRAHIAGDATLVISLMIDLVCLESTMLHQMARTSSSGLEKLTSERVIRLPEIDVLMDCALKAGDQDAQLLAEVLLQNHHRFMATAQAELSGLAAS